MYENVVITLARTSRTSDDGESLMYRLTFRQVEIVDLKAAVLSASVQRRVPNTSTNTRRQVRRPSKSIRTLAEQNQAGPTLDELGAVSRF